MSVHPQYTELSRKTADDLRSMALSLRSVSLSNLSLPEVDAAVELVAQMVPAGNVPGVILNGLARLAGRRVAPQTVRRDLHLLFRGVEQMLDRAVYGAFFAGPAAVIWGYQNLLKLAGKTPEDAFPDGVWQFYVDYALREDTARHTNETHGFDTLLRQHQIRLDPVDRVTAWAMAAVHCLHEYDRWLENEWRERTYIAQLRRVTLDRPGAESYAGLYAQWQRQIPYRRDAAAGAEVTWAQYRRARFDAFIEPALSGLPPEQRRAWQEAVAQAEAHELPAYQQQMSILAYLDPGPYGETHVPIPLRDARIGVIHRGHYYLLPACAPGTDRPAEVQAVRGQVAALMAPSPLPPTPWPDWVAQIKRIEWARLGQQFSPALARELDALRYAPILINSDPRPRDLPLSELRQAPRGVGSHALTIFDGGQTIALDQSHIFFDGAWGAALAEVLTNEALSWAAYLRTLPLPVPAERPPYRLGAGFTGADRERIEGAARAAVEVGAETEAVHLPAILSLRRLFKQRSDLLALTVNDLLVCYRAFHAALYRPDAALVDELQALVGAGGEARRAAQAALEALAADRQVNPPVLIPVDASACAPRDRLYPMTFIVPLGELELVELHGQTVAALAAYRHAAGDRGAAYATFDGLQRRYLAALAGLGQVFSRAKEIAQRGESDSMGTLKMLAHMAPPVQRMLDQIPGRFDVLNDLIKGREVFSNVGAVAPGSTLLRFITAKDDNEKKTLAWGVITDAGGVMRITLRDFRPHVRLLAACGRRDLALRLAADYVTAYAQGLNRFVSELIHITRASRETRLGTGAADE